MRKATTVGLSELIGKTIIGISDDHGKLSINCEDGSLYCLYHSGLDLARIEDHYPPQ